MLSRRFPDRVERPDPGRDLYHHDAGPGCRPGPAGGPGPCDVGLAAAEARLDGDCPCRDWTGRELARGGTGGGGLQSGLQARLLTIDDRRLTANHQIPGMAAQRKLTLGSARGRERLRRRLLAWYDTERRDLPWRQDRDPYRVWLSEIMLQQTRVAAVLEHYQEFLRRFPTVEKLEIGRA